MAKEKDPQSLMHAVPEVPAANGRVVFGYAVRMVAVPLWFTKSEDWTPTAKRAQIFPEQKNAADAIEDMPKGTAEIVQVVGA